jgi:hypothetical protein
MASGSRYDDNAPPPYGGNCVGGEFDAGIDTPPGTFDVTTCPASYSIVLPSTSLISRYRAASQQFGWKTQSTGCSADLMNATHLAMPETAQEAMELTQALSGMTTLYYVGAVQNPAATVLGDGWIFLDDTPVPAAVWEVGDPDDEDNVENAAENFAMLARQVQRLNDDAGTNARAAICECDGKPIGTLATQYIAGNP